MGLYEIAVSKEVFVVCPKETCSALSIRCDSCTQVSFGKVCSTSLGYYRDLARGKRKWIPHKTFHFIPPSASLKNMFNDLMQRLHLILFRMLRMEVFGKSSWLQQISCLLDDECRLV